MIENFNTKEKVFEYLQSHYIASLATVSSEGIPYSALIYIFADPDLNFYFFSKEKTKKIQNLIHNNKAALSLFDPEFPRTMQAQGTVQKSEDQVLYDHLLQNHMEQAAKGENGFYWPPPESKIFVEGALNLYRFETTWLRFADFTEPKTAILISLDDNFAQLIPPQQ